MLADIRSLVLGDVLSQSSRTQLTGWLLGNKTGGARMRARLDKDWQVGDKTGSGDNGTTNDAGLIWPPNRKPVVVSIYLTGTSRNSDQRNAALAAVGYAISTAIRL